jgi:hypothetical protein
MKRVMNLIHSLVIFFTLLSSSYGSNYHLSSFCFENVTWVLSPSSTNHDSACRSIHLVPTPLDRIIPWNYEIMKAVVSGLNLSLVQYSHGLHGCCVPGLWCNDFNDECFTQSLQSNFVNYHSSHPLASHTVYTCLQNTNSYPTTVKIEMVEIEKDQIIISGYHFGNNEKNIVSVLGTSPITEIESCNTVCQSCESSPCAKDNACVLVGSSYSCLMFCSGPSDTSCPCGTICQHVNVYTSQSNYVTTHFCAPKGLECDEYSASTLNQFQGRSPRVYNWMNDSSSLSSTENTFDVTVSLLASTTDDLPVEVEMLSCTSSDQCSDSSPFTSETCHQGKCAYTPLVTQLGSTLPAIRDRTTPFSYLMFVAHDLDTEHDLFESRVRLDGKLLASVSKTDDVPQEYSSIGFHFHFFGHQVSDMAINPNGLISFPPYPNCQALAGTLYVSPSGPCLDLTFPSVLSMAPGRIRLPFGGQIGICVLEAMHRQSISSTKL